MSVLDDSAYAQARQLRNDISHNESPASVGMTVSKSESDKALAYGMGMKSYVTSNAIFENGAEAVTLLRRTLEVVRKAT